ncbi:MAG TPA: (d)CMP kinase [Anaeromyxobacteraceae bacterium]|nr:(d)CMP kinase [Anaeromyxobacteraceae bacterium]
MTEEASDRPFIVALDGPAGAGKSTAARLLAGRLGFALVDTGAIYRAVALAAARAAVAFDDDRALSGLLPTLRIRFEASESGPRVLLGDEDVSLAIRTPAISLGASAVSARPVVRAALLGLQRALATARGVRGAVLEGRDIGTVVFPDADLKVFITASPEVRARRRFAELSQKGAKVALGEVRADQERRDRDDAERPLAPLRPAADALLLDTSALAVEEVVERLAGLARERLEARGRSR